MVDDQIEEWKPIPGYGDKYEASSFGRIRVKRTGKIRKQRLERFGYMRINLYPEVGVTFGRNVHRLVMEAFHGPSPLDVDHIDANRANNRLENLRYCTTKENNLEMHKRNAAKYSGAVWRPSLGKWSANVWVNGKKYYLGLFAAREEAELCYQTVGLGYLYGELPLPTPRRYSRSSQFNQVK